MKHIFNVILKFRVSLLLVITIRSPLPTCLIPCLFISESYREVIEKKSCSIRIVNRRRNDTHMYAIDASLTSFATTAPGRPETMYNIAFRKYRILVEQCIEKCIFMFAPTSTDALRPN